jgi:hypothetical protein
MRLADRLRNTLDMALTSILLAIPLGIGALCVAGAAHYGSEIYKAYVSSRDWLSAEATVVKASVAKDCGGGRYSSHYSLTVVYSYEVEGRPYSNSRIVFGNGLCSSKVEVESRMNKFPPGARTFVYYDAHQPSQSVLYRGNVENGTLFGFAFFILSNFGCLWWFAKLLLGAKNGKSSSDRIDAYLRSRHRTYDASVRQKTDA